MKGVQSNQLPIDSWLNLPRNGAVMGTHHWPLLLAGWIFNSSNSQIKSWYWKVLSCWSACIASIPVSVTICIYVDPLSKHPSGCDLTGVHRMDLAHLIIKNLLYGRCPLLNIPVEHCNPCILFSENLRNSIIHLFPRLWSLIFHSCSSP